MLKNEIKVQLEKKINKKRLKKRVAIKKTRTKFNKKNK
jgi:hypothetical protein